MHVRIPRAEHGLIAAEAERRGVTVRQLVCERLLQTSGKPAADRSVVVQQLIRISAYGADVLGPALEAMSMCPPDAFIHMEHIGRAVLAALERDEHAATATP